MPPAGQPDELAAALQREQQARGGGEQEVQQGSGGGDLLLAPAAGDAAAAAADAALASAKKQQQQHEQQQEKVGQAQAWAEAEAARGGKIDKQDANATAANNIDAGAQADSSEAPAGAPDEPAEEGSRKRQKRTARQRKVRFDPMGDAAHVMV